MTTPARCDSARVDIALVCGGRWHDFDYARLRLLQWLETHDSVRCAVYSDFSQIEAICAADAVIAYTCDVRPSQVQAALLRDRIAAGGRLLALHATNSAIDAPEPGGERIFRTPDVMPTFAGLLGNRFLAHPKIAEYEIEVCDSSHPLVAGLSDFRTTDEIYVSEISGDLHVILDTEYSGPCPGFETQSVPGRTRHPILFTRPEGAGEVTYFTLGHCRGRFDISDMGVDDLEVIDRIAWDSPEFLEIMRRSVAWVVHGNQWSDCSASSEGAAA
jgi:uncharacterized protein